MVIPGFEFRELNLTINNEILKLNFKKYEFKDQVCSYSLTLTYLRIQRNSKVQQWKRDMFSGKKQKELQLTQKYKDR